MNSENSQFENQGQQQEEIPQAMTEGVSPTKKKLSPAQSSVKKSSHKRLYNDTRANPKEMSLDGKGNDAKSTKCLRTDSTYSEDSSHSFQTISTLVKGAVMKTSRAIPEAPEGVSSKKKKLSPAQSSVQKSSHKSLYSDASANPKEMSFYDKNNDVKSTHCPETGSTFPKDSAHVTPSTSTSVNGAVKKTSRAIPEGMSPKKKKLSPAQSSVQKSFHKSLCSDDSANPKEMSLDGENNDVKSIQCQEIDSMFSEDVTRDTPSTSSTLVLEAAKKSEGLIDKVETVKLENNSNTHGKGGLAHTMHGNIYQLKLLMLFAIRALEKGYEFNLGTEVEDAAKFDDIVFKYKIKDMGGTFARFVQVKHKQDQCKKITAYQLLTENNGDFSLKKYLISYCKIKKNYNKMVLQDFTLYTNIDFDYDKLKKSGIVLKEIEESDPILCVKSEKATRYKLVGEQHKLYDKLRNTSDLNVIEDIDIKEFLEKLVFAVNQPNEDELGKIIKDELKNKFNLLNADPVYALFYLKMLKWFKEKRPEKGKEGVWLNAKIINDIFEAIKTKISGQVCVGICLRYSDELETYDIEFDNNSLFKELKDFLEDSCSEKIFFIIAHEKTILSKLNVYCALEALKKQAEFAQYKKKDSYCFIHSNDLSRPKTQKYIMDAAKIENSNILLIIECEFAAPGDDILHELREISQEKNKKIILIATETEHTTVFDRLSNVIKYKDEASFADLTKESKETLLKKNVTLQGKTISLTNLYTWDNVQQFIDQKTLAKLIVGEEIIIGSKLEDLGEVEDYYINRSLRPVTFNKINFKKDLKKIPDLFVICGAKLGLKNINNVYEFTAKDKDSAEIKFNALYKQNTGSNIHWLESHSDKLTWHKSYGCLSNLVKYKMMEKVVNSDIKNPKFLIIGEDNLVDKNNHNKIVIISDTAGMGKSIVLTSISRKLKENDPSLWIIRINLNDHTQVLNKELENRESSHLEFIDQDINEVVNFLLKDLLKLLPEQSKNYLEEKLLENCYHNLRKIVLLFDGFDEISPNYKNIVIDLLQSLVKKSNVEKLFVTTRPNMCEELEGKLKVFSHVLYPLSIKEKKEFFRRFWTKKLNLDPNNKKQKLRLRKYIESIIKLISKSFNDRNQEFMNIPLQINMIAEVFQRNGKGNPPEWQGCEEFLKSNCNEIMLQPHFDIIGLYELFVERKFCDINLVEKNRIDITTPGGKKMADEEYERFKQKYGMLALRILFNEDDLKILALEQSEELLITIDDIKVGNHNEGIVDQIIDGKPNFIHRTFAEYFASFPIAKKMLEAPTDTLQCIDNVLNTSPIFINSIVKQLNGKQEIITNLLEIPLLHYVIIKNHFNFIKFLIDCDNSDWAKKLDASGKTPLHYAIENNNPNIDAENNILDYESSNLVKFINIKDNSNRSALDYALQKDDIAFAFKLLLKDATIDNLSDENVNKLMLKTLESTSASDETHEYGPIQEKLLLKKPDMFADLKEHQRKILTYFFVHGRVIVIIAILETVEDFEERKNILTNADDSYTFLDLINGCDDLDDLERLLITKYLLHHNITTKRTSSGENQCSCNDIKQILQAAAKYGHIKTFKTYTKYFNENYEEHIKEDGNTPLHIACSGGSKLNIIKWLIESGHLINAKNDKNETPLLKAIKACSELSVIKYLISKGADVNLEDIFHNTPLSCAVESNQKDVIKFLHKKGALISEKASQSIKDKLEIFI